LPAGIEAVWQQTESDSYLFLLNHRQETVAVSLEELKGLELLTQQGQADQINLEPFAVKIIRLEKAR